MYFSNITRSWHLKLGMVTFLQMYTLFAYMRNTINLKVLLLERDHLCQEHNLDSKRNANCFTFSREIDLGLFCFCLVCMEKFNTIFKGHYSIYFIGLCITRHWHLKWHFQTLYYYASILLFSGTTNIQKQFAKHSPQLANHVMFCWYT